ncbi:MAG TPA: hypothetical protein VHI52_07830, partial [Verrucomicrobiae bacterium]|nr:hypothetical protein [Verrucomicrobiae bacterium]
GGGLLLAVLILLWPHNEVRSFRTQARDPRLKIVGAKLYPPGPYELHPKLSRSEAARYYACKALISIGVPVEWPSRWVGSRWATAPPPYQNHGMLALECDWHGSTEDDSPDNIHCMRLNLVDSSWHRAWTPLIPATDASLGIDGPASARHFDLSCRVRTNLIAGLYHLVNMDSSNVLASIWVK